MTKQAERADLSWEGGSCQVFRQSGMLGPLNFHFPNGQTISPLHIAPWTKEKESGEREPGIMKKLRGEWPCIPFGRVTEEALPAAKWKALQRGGEGKAFWGHPDYPHGYSSNALWEWELKEEDRIKMILHYPKEMPIDSVERTIQGRNQKLSLQCRIRARRTCSFPIGIHPIFALPSLAQSLEIKTPDFKLGLTFPSYLEPSSLLARGQEFASLSQVLGRNKEFYDFTRLPLSSPGEDLLQLCGVREGKVTLLNREENYQISLLWNQDDFPSCLLWVSNRGRSYAPWNSKNICLGVEPVASAFDLGTAHALGINPINKRGINTAVHLEAGELWETAYSIEGKILQGNKE